MINRTLHFSLFLGEESVFVREIGNVKVCENTEDDGDEAFNYEDPLPPSKTTPPFEKGEGICEQRRESTKNYGCEIENSQTMKKFRHRECVFERR